MGIAEHTDEIVHTLDHYYYYYNYYYFWVRVGFL